MTLPRVVIVGRPNVGKSSLLNALAGERVAIVDATPGVTRDRISVEISDFDRRFELIDTGGIGIVDRDDLEAHVEGQITIGVELADVIIFAVDGRAGPTPHDAVIADRLRRRGLPVVVAVNKIDAPSLESTAYEFGALGLEPVIPVSAEQRRGLHDLLDAVVARMRPAEAPPDPVLRIALVGRRNAGKSTYLNALAGQERVIVSEVPGTTRDAVDVRIDWRGRALVVIDTAGVRKRRQISGSIDFYSQNRTRKAIARCDVACLLLDAGLEIGRLDKQLAGEIVDAHKPCVIVVNKWDLAAAAPAARPATPADYNAYIGRHLPGLHFAPIVCISARDGLRVEAPVQVAFSVAAQAQVRVGTGELNRVVARLAAAARPPRPTLQTPRLYFATQVDVAPPTIVFFTNEPSAFGPAYRRYLANKLRESFAFSEIPLRLVFRRREQSDA